MTDPDLIEWSAKDYSMRDFISKVKNSLPVLVITTTGQSGCDDTLHEVGAGEMYWVFGIQMQKRAVARTCDKKYLSIPAEHPLRFHLIDSSGKWGKNTTSVARLIDLLQKGSHDIEMMPEKNKNLSFMIGANTGSIQRFDAMTLIDTYEEKYLLAYSVHAGAMHSITVGIPVYMDITMDIAVGFKNGTQQQFREWFAEVKRIASDYVATPIETCKEVIMFENIPADYEYVYLKNYVNLSNKTDAANVKPSSAHVAKNVYSKTAQAGPSIPKKMSELTGSSNPEKNYSRNRNSSRKLGQKTILPLMPELADEKPRRAHPCKTANISAAQHVNLTNKLQVQASRDLEKAGRTVQERTLPSKGSPSPDKSGENISPSSDNAHSQLNPRSDTIRNQELNSELIFRKQLSRVLIAESKLKVDLASKPSQVTERPSCEYVTLDVVQGSWVGQYKNIRDVPVDVDVINMTIDDVSHCLKLLNLCKYGAMMRSEDVDGSLLKQLTCQALVDKFGFSDYDATKLMHFMNGWRPR